MRKIQKLMMAFIALFFSTTLVFGQGFTVSPTSFDNKLEPGQSKDVELIVKNTTNQKQSYNLGIYDWTMDESGTPEYFSPGSKSYSCAKWITLSSSLIELGPNEAKAVIVTTTVPHGDEATKWAAILVSPAEEQLKPAFADQELVTAGQTVIRIGVPLFQSPNSNDNYAAKIGELKSIPGDGDLPTYQALVTNKGGKVVIGNVYVTLSNVQTGEEVNLKPFEVVALPNTRRNFKFELPKTVKPGSYTLTCILDYSDDRDYEGTQMQIEVK